MNKNRHLFLKQNNKMDKDRMCFQQPSQTPPNGLSSSDVPLFVSLGFDDNGYSGLKNKSNPYGMSWASSLFNSLKNPNGEKCKASFYFSTFYFKKEIFEPPHLIKMSWRDSINIGHEAGNHTHNHYAGKEYSVEKWMEEIQTCTEWLARPYVSGIEGNSILTGADIQTSQIYGFRAPFLEYNDNLFIALKKLGFEYDCSISEGWQSDHDGSNYFWPYHIRVENSCKGYDEKIENKQEFLWEMPIYAVIVPPDSECEKYGIHGGLRHRCASLHNFFNEENGKVTGLDWNLFVDFKMTKKEFLATLKYTFDLRAKGNRAPFLLGAHSDIFSPDYSFCEKSTWRERQEAVEEFLDYVLSHSFACVTSLKDVLEWIKNPKPLSERY